jgi:hypothetical protein
VGAGGQAPVPRTEALECRRGRRATRRTTAAADGPCYATLPVSLPLPESVAPRECATCGSDLTAPTCPECGWNPRDGVAAVTRGSGAGRSSYRVSGATVGGWRAARATGCTTAAGDVRRLPSSRPPTRCLRTETGRACLPASSGGPAISSNVALRELSTRHTPTS